MKNQYLGKAKALLSSKSLISGEIDKTIAVEQQYLEKAKANFDAIQQSINHKDLLHTKVLEKKIPLSKIQAGRKAVNKAKRLGNKAIHVKELNSTSIAVFLKKNTKTEWYKRFSASLSLSVINPKSLSTEAGLGLGWSFNKNLSFGASYAIRTYGSFSKDTILLIREPLNTLRAFVNFAVYKNLFVQSGVQVVSNVANSLSEIEKNNTCIPYIMIGRNFNLSQDFRWHLGTRFNLLKNEKVYSQRISIEIAINRILNSR